MFGHAVFGWDPFAVDWFLASAPAPVVPVEEPSGGRRIKPKRKRKQAPEAPYEPVKTRPLTPEEREEWDQVFRSRKTTPVLPDAEPAYVAPLMPSLALRKPASNAPAPSQPSVIGAVFDATATARQRHVAYRVFDKFQERWDEIERERQDAAAEQERQYHAAIQHARAVAQARQEAMRAEQQRQDDEFMALLLLMHEL